MEVRIGEPRESERCEAGFLDNYPELLMQFPDQGLFRPLVPFDLAAGKLPKAAKRLVLRALRDQHPAIRVDKRGGGNEQEFHACGLLFRDIIEKSQIAIHPTAASVASGSNLSSLAADGQALPHEQPIPHENQDLRSLVEKHGERESTGTKRVDPCKDAGHTCKTVQHQSRKLYVIRAGKSTLFKIGISNNPKARLRTLQIKSPLPLELLLAVTVESVDREREAHRILASCRQHGEWFDLGDSADYFAGAE